ncbi:MAG: amidohydrolase family protein [Thermoflavifilum sp.]|nr:amidohydrolase family protein [Thermoflavifilum sp.]
MVIDAHQHFWKYDPVKDSWITDEMQVLKRDYLPEMLHREMTAAGVHQSVAVQATQSEQETQFLIQLATAYRFITGVVGWVDLQSSGLEERLRYYQSVPIVKGFRHIVQDEPDDFLLRHVVQQGIAQMGKAGFTYDILIYPHQLPAVLKLIEHLPEQPLVVDHLAKPLIRQQRREPWAGQMRALSKASHVYVKLSGWATEAHWQRWQPEDIYPYFDVVFEAFGPARLLFGSDWPVCLLSATYAQVKHTVEQYVQRYASDAYDAVMGGNAQRFYRLGN